MPRPRASRVALVALLATLTACVRPILPPAPPESGPPPDAGPPAASDPPAPTLRIRDPDGVVRAHPLEEYVVGSVLAEADLRGLEPETAARVAELQAVLVRTYALANRSRHDHEGFSLCSTTHCQVYRPEAEFGAARRALVRAAVRRTSGRVLLHGGRPINAVYHAHCGGRTSDATVPWGGTTPVYLRGVPDPFCEVDAPSAWRFETPRQTLAAALDRDARTTPGGTLTEVVVAARDPAGRALEVTLHGRNSRTVRGEVFRAVVSAAFGPRALRSTRFSVRLTGDQVVFEGQGFGHGVGLCQRGAVARAKEGHASEEILAHYYPGASLARYHEGTMDASPAARE